MAPSWKVERRQQPWGEAGVRSSLNEVAKKAAEGAVHPEVRTYTGRKLHEAQRRGQSVKRPRDRASVILSVVQNEKLWMPDPVGSEYIPAAHLMACDGPREDGSACIEADDCDGKATLLGAMLSCVGIYTLIVGHAYNSRKQIEHVLTAAWLDKRWYYADGSTNLPLGKCVPFSRERLLSIPNVQLLCDDTVCIGRRRFDPDELDFIDEGVFVGVGEPPSLEGLSSNLIWETEAPSPTLLELAARRF